MELSLATRRRLFCWAELDLAEGLVSFSSKDESTSILAAAAAPRSSTDLIIIVGEADPVLMFGEDDEDEEDEDGDWSSSKFGAGGDGDWLDEDCIKSVENREDMGKQKKKPVFERLAINNAIVLDSLEEEPELTDLHAKLRKTSVEQTEPSKTIEACTTTTKGEDEWEDDVLAKNRMLSELLCILKL
ncbi:TLR4 interactor with leucine rich repeats [Striga asiatica]|uniref:TLR4 interactor with leucine rich repeats n=1 Tax=Striga asiatica TaxID=4170 RepID=A0A5A7PBP9_STRAF|nr:TLR4 interactor with leucine rich repeats [Striga asiatica]